MRTAIYVYADDLNFQLRGDIDHVIKYALPTSTLVKTSQGSVTLSKGTYKIVLDKPSEIRLVDGTPGDVDIIVIANDKRPWPDPPQKLVAMGVSKAALESFMTVASGVGDGVRGLASQATPAAPPSTEPT
jgi:hypothetical protein